MLIEIHVRNNPADTDFQSGRRLKRKGCREESEGASDACTSKPLPTIQNVHRIRQPR
jgi:hypothetical protein